MQYQRQREHKRNTRDAGGWRICPGVTSIEHQLVVRGSEQFFSDMTETAADGKQPTAHRCERVMLQPCCGRDCGVSYCSACIVQPADGALECRADPAYSAVFVFCRLIARTGARLEFPWCYVRLYCVLARRIFEQPMPLHSIHSLSARAFDMRLHEFVWLSAV